MTSMKRVPKGSSSGGQFAGSVGEGKNNVPAAPPSFSGSAPVERKAVDLSKVNLDFEDKALDEARKSQLKNIVSKTEADQMMEGPDWTLVSGPDISYDRDGEADSVSVDLGYVDPRVTVEAFRDHNNEVSMSINGVYDNGDTYWVYPKDGRSIGQAAQMLDRATNEEVFMDHEYLEKAEPVNEYAKELGIEGQVVRSGDGYAWQMRGQDFNRESLAYHDIGKAEDREALGEDGVITLYKSHVQLSEGGSADFSVAGGVNTRFTRREDQDRVQGLACDFEDWLAAKAHEAQGLGD